MNETVKICGGRKSRQYVLYLFLDNITNLNFYPMTICRKTPTSIKVGDNGSYVPG